MIYSQKFVDYSLLTELTKAEISAISPIAAKYGMSLYKVTYETPDVHTEKDTASGLLLVPVIDEKTFFPLLCYQHGTVGSKTDVPSNLQGGYQLAMIAASQGYVTVVPDFLGLGEARGFHPYVHAATEASAAIDMMYAVADELTSEIGFDLNDQVFVSGYSQGGHAAMAAHRDLEMNHNNRFTVTASGPMSGPYSVSEKMIDFTLGGAEYGTVSYLPYVALSMKESYPILLANYNVDNMFKAEYTTDIWRFYNGEIGLWDLNSILISKLNTNEGGTFPGKLMQDSVLNYLVNNLDHPIMTALRDNDSYDWAPNAPTRLYYCTGDDQVFWENATLAADVMTANGATDVKAENRGDFDHGGCVFWAASGALDFFSQFQMISTGINDLVSDQATFYPNPTNGLLEIELNDVQTAQVEIYDMVGRNVLTTSIDQSMTFDITQLPSGHYNILFITDRGTSIEQLIKI